MKIFSFLLINCTSIKEQVISEICSSVRRGEYVHINKRLYDNIYYLNILGNKVDVYKFIPKNIKYKCKPVDSELSYKKYVFDKFIFEDIIEELLKYIETPNLLLKYKNLQSIMPVDEIYYNQEMDNLSSGIHNFYMTMKKLLEDIYAFYIEKEQLFDGLKDIDTALSSAIELYTIDSQTKEFTSMCILIFQIFTNLNLELEFIKVAICKLDEVICIASVNKPAAGEFQLFAEEFVFKWHIESAKYLNILAKHMVDIEEYYKSENFTILRHIGNVESCYNNIHEYVGLFPLKNIKKIIQNNSIILKDKLSDVNVRSIINHNNMLFVSDLQEIGLVYSNEKFKKIFIDKDNKICSYILLNGKYCIYKYDLCSLKEILNDKLKIEYNLKKDSEVAEENVKQVVEDNVKQVVEEIITESISEESEVLSSIRQNLVNEKDDISVENWSLDTHLASDIRRDLKSSDYNILIDKLFNLIDIYQIIRDYTFVSRDSSFLEVEQLTIKLNNVSYSAANMPDNTNTVKLLINDYSTLRKTILSLPKNIQTTELIFNYLFREELIDEILSYVFENKSYKIILENILVFYKISTKKLCLKKFKMHLLWICKHADKCDLAFIYLKHICVLELDILYKYFIQNKLVVFRYSPKLVYFFRVSNYLISSFQDTSCLLDVYSHFIFKDISLKLNVLRSILGDLTRLLASISNDKSVKLFLLDDVYVGLNSKEIDMSKILEFELIK